MSRVSQTSFVAGTEEEILRTEAAFALLMAPLETECVDGVGGDSEQESQNCFIRKGLQD